MALQLFKIASTTVESPTGEINFTSIPSGYTDLIVYTSARATGSAPSGNVRFNDSSSSYSARILNSYVTGVESQTDTAISFNMNRGTFTANAFASIAIYIPNYTSSNYKSVSIDAAPENNSAAANAANTTFVAGLWSNTAAITKITLLPISSDTFATNTTATLYGVL